MIDWFWSAGPRYEYMWEPVHGLGGPQMVHPHIRELAIQLDELQYEVATRAGYL